MLRPRSLLKPPVGGRLNGGHPLAQGLSYALPCAEGAGLLTAELVGTGPQALVNGAVFRRTSEAGINIPSSASTGAGVLIPGDRLPRDRGSVVVWITTDADWLTAGAVYPSLFSTSPTSSNANMIGMWNSAGSGRIWYLLTDNSVNVWSFTDSVALAASTDYMLALTWDSLAASPLLTAYRDGLVVGTAGAPAHVPAVNPTTWYLGNDRSDLSTRKARATIRHLLVYNRPLGQTEIQALRASPYEIYSPLRALFLDVVLALRPPTLRVVAPALGPPAY